jgi:hypothetical protein
MERGEAATMEGGFSSGVDRDAGLWDSNGIATMTPDSPASPPATAPRRTWPLVAAFLGVIVVLVVVALWLLQKIVALPGTAAAGSVAVVKEIGHQAMTIAQAFSRRDIRQEFLSSSVTVGGTTRLQVATLQEHETFRRKESDSVAWGLVALPDIVVQADVPVEYTYYLDFDGPWEFARENVEVVVHAPPIMANAPSPDISKLTFYSLEGHVWQDDKAVRERLQGSLDVALRARAAEHVLLVREIARRQTAGFVEKWLADSFSDGRAFHVKVVFPDEVSAPVAEKPGGS